MTKVKVICSYCGQLFEKTESKLRLDNFCSNDCKFKYQNKRLRIKCHYCNKNITIKRSVFKKYKNHFCSQDCLGKWHSEFLSGKNNPCYKGGSIEYCYKFNEECKESNREKFSRKCFLCGLHEINNINKNNKQSKLSVHHVDLNKKQGCETDWNLISLCIHCHAKCHGKNNSKYYEWLFSTMLYYREMILEYNGKIDYKSL